MAPRKIIIDTDPGVDDILAMLLACSALPSEVQVLLISVTYGNIDVRNCLRNVISLFHHVEKEITWREQSGRAPGFDSVRMSKPLVAVGPDHPLADTMLMADYFRGSDRDWVWEDANRNADGRDGLGDIHSSHPHLTPADTWKKLFESSKESTDPETGAVAEELQKHDKIFTTTREPGHKEILRLLRENEADTITVVAIGPLTNLALAAAEDPETFLKLKEVVVMGGSISYPGNVRSVNPTHHAPQPPIPEPPFRLIKRPPGPLRILLNLRNQITPTAEFNTFADSVAAARVYALTSPRPSTTMPPTPPAPPGQPEGKHPPPYLAPYPEKLSRRLKVTLFPLDITEKHELTRGEFDEAMKPHLDASSPLAEWTAAFMKATFDKVESLESDVSGDAVGLALHDPMCVWYCLTDSDPQWKMIKDEDIRVETSGQWTRGMNVVDRRSRTKGDDGDEEEVPGDRDGWLSGGRGNRLQRCVGSPGEKTFGGWMLKRIFSS